MILRRVRSRVSALAEALAKMPSVAAEHLADARQELTDANKPLSYQRPRLHARVLKPLAEILGLDAFGAQRTRAPQPTKHVFRFRGSTTPYIFYTDGSLRRVTGLSRAARRAVKGRDLRRLSRVGAL